MPINASMEYFRAEERFRDANTREEKVAALEEMVRHCPTHKGAENLKAQLKARLAKLKKPDEKKGAKKGGITKEGDAQICLLGAVNSGKSTVLKKVTGAKTRISPHQFTTTEPEIGMMNYKGVKIQIIEIPSFFRADHMSIVRTCDGAGVVGDVSELYKILVDFHIDKKTVPVDSNWPTGKIKDKLWNMLDMIIVYTKDGKKMSPMALAKGSTVRDFSEKIHKDCISDLRFARLWRSKIMKQVGLKYELEDGDIVELYT